MIFWHTFRMPVFVWPLSCWLAQRYSFCTFKEIEKYRFQSLSTNRGDSNFTLKYFTYAFSPVVGETQFWQAQKYMIAFLSLYHAWNPLPLETFFLLHDWGSAWPSHKFLFWPMILRSNIQYAERLLLCFSFILHRFLPAMCC